MIDYTEKKCPICRQRLRFPDNVGGILMACPTCGTKFYSDSSFGVGTAKEESTVNLLK